MPQQELLKQTIEFLNRTGIEYMMTGSLVSSLQGEPRSTIDIDIIIVFTESSIGVLQKAFPPPEYYLSEEAIREAIKNQSMFNLISVADGLKVDFWLLTDEPFDASRFSRRYPIVIDDLTIMASRPEDTILAKLRWAKELGGSEKQFVDALRVYEVQHDSLDQNYLNEWAKRLNVLEDYQHIKDRAMI